MCLYIPKVCKSPEIFIAAAKLYRLVESRCNWERSASSLQLVPHLKRGLMTIVVSQKQANVVDFWDCCKICLIKVT